MKCKPVCMAQSGSTRCVLTLHKFSCVVPTFLKQAAGFNFKMSSSFQKTPTLIRFLLCQFQVILQLKWIWAKTFILASCKLYLSIFSVHIFHILMPSLQKKYFLGPENVLKTLNCLKKINKNFGLRIVGGVHWKIKCWLVTQFK